VPHDLAGLLPDENSVQQILEAMERESRRSSASPDIPFLRGYFLYFLGERDAAEAILRDSPDSESARHYRLFLDAIERQRGASRIGRHPATRAIAMSASSSSREPAAPFTPAIHEVAAPHDDPATETDSRWPA
jgi:hypothetical protein